MEIFKNEFEILCEYATMETGMHSTMYGEPRETGPKHMSMNDILDAQNNIRRAREDDATAPKVLPAPLTQNDLDILSKIYAESTSLQVNIERALVDNPNASMSRRVTEGLEGMKNKLERIKSIIKSMDSELLKLSIEM